MKLFPSLLSFHTDRAFAPIVVASFVFLAIALTGCTTTVRDSAPAAGDELSQCERLFVTLDAAVDAAGVQDGGATPIKGFRYLRVNRFLASYRAEVMSPVATAWWIGQMQRLDGDARAIELANLSDEDMQSLPADLRDRERLIDRVHTCSHKLVRRDLADADRQERLRKVAEVPDDYQVVKRILGLYPLTAVAFYQGVLNYQAETRQIHSTPLEALPVTGRLIGYQPKVSIAQPEDSVSTDIERSRANPLGVPMPEGPAFMRLITAYAPLLEVDESGRHDRVGAPVLTTQGMARVNTSNPTVFTRIAHARYRGEPLLQLVYSFWFPARPKTGALDILGGHLDAVIWRVTLDEKGAPLLYDTIHSCGCYHMFFPTHRVQLRPRELAFEEPVLVPAQLGRQNSGERILIRIAADTHYIENVRYDTSTKVDEQRTYTLADDDQLRSLSWPGGRRRSLFRPDGIVSGSQRGERYLYWPMGVREPGAMRQWGRHATAFVGRRHFDDPTLIERYFEYRTNYASR